MNRSLRMLTAVAALGSVVTAASADGKRDAEMRQLAATSGCVACHSVESGKPGPDGGKPIGPAWQDVAERYRGKKAAGELVKVVLQGNNEYNSHWKGKVSGIAMPPNAVAIKEGDAQRLVTWILQLHK